MILCLIGDLQDLNLVYIGWVAEKMGFRVIKLSEEKFGLEWNYFFDDKDTWGGEIRFHNEIIKFSNIKGVYVRFSPEPKCLMDSKISQDEKDVLILERRCAIQYLLNSFQCVVINKPSAGRSNGSKPFQMSLLSKAGFKVPKWIVTNKLEHLNNFQKNCPNGVIYKSCSGLRSHVREVDSDIVDLLKTGTSPVIFQEFIMGSDVRIHTIGEFSFGTEVISDGIDYRFHDGLKKYNVKQLPKELTLRCKHYAESEGLKLAGFDFKVVNESWYCLEVNPVPTFLPYEMQTGQPIAKTIIHSFLSDRESQENHLKKTFS